MTELDKILEIMAKKAEKRKSDLKRTYNSIMKKKEEDGLKGVIPEETLLKICLLGTCKKYGLDTSLVDELLSQKEEEPEPEKEDEIIPGSEEITLDELESEIIAEKPKFLPMVEQIRGDDRIRNIILETGLMEDDILAFIQKKMEELHGLVDIEGAIFIVSKDLGVEVKEPKEKPKKTTKKSQKVSKITGNEGWKDIFATTQDPDEMEFEEGEGNGDFEELEKFKPMINVRYQMKLRHPQKTAYCHDGIGKDGEPYRSYAVEITLLKKGELEKRYKINTGYTFWMPAALEGDKPKLFDYFAKFWEDLGEIPDDRVFEFLKTQKTSKKGYNYNIFEFREI